MSGMLIGLAALFGADQAVKAMVEKKFKLPGENNAQSTPDRNNTSEKASCDCMNEAQDKPQYEDILDGRIRLRRFHNKGMMLGKFADHSDTIKYVSIAGTAIVAAHFIVYMFHKEPNGLKWAFTFILSGALSNMVDRIRHGYVVDYFSVNSSKKKKKTIIYNLGDVFIIIGTFIAVATTVFTSGK